MPRHGAILNLGGPLADGDHIEDVPLSTLRVSAVALFDSGGSGAPSLFLAVQAP